MNILQKFEQEQIGQLTENKVIPDFKAGDTVKVHVKIKEGVTERVQIYEGLCIAITNRGLGSSFVVRKISHGEGVERKFPLYSPIINNVEVVKRGRVRRAKIYYIRNLSGKKARIKEIRNVKEKLA